MKTKSLIELRELDLHILEGIDVGATINVIGVTVFPNAKNKHTSVYNYIRKHLRLGLIEKVSRGKFKLTKNGKYFIKVLEKLQ